MKLPDSCFIYVANYDTMWQLERQGEYYLLINEYISYTAIPGEWIISQLLNSSEHVILE
jgi:hypothetical protein